MTQPAYRDLLARLVPARRFGIVFGLDRIRAVLDRLGAPDRRLGAVIHVGGTNGKGSTVALTAALVRAAGLRVATYTSPHLSSLRERITIDGQMIGEDAIVDVAARVSAVGGDELTFFEQITAIGMLAIADAGVDVTVLEVGLGGRLDATNVVDAPVAVVTGVALDHEAILGSTLDAIAREKAGIFKAGRAAIVGASGELPAVAVLVELARAAGVSSVTVVDDAAIAAVPALGLEGAHQRANAAAALAAVRVLATAAPIAGGSMAAGSSAVGSSAATALARFLDDRLAVVAALACVRHPGRFERVGDIILDGAHNPHGARALAGALSRESAVPIGEPAVRPTLILAVSADKDAAAIVRALAPAVGTIIATRYQQERALPPDDLARVVAAVAPDLAVVAEPDLTSALARARSVGATPVVIAGSLFIVGEARVILCGAEADPVWVSDPAAGPHP